MTRPQQKTNAPLVERLKFALKKRGLSPRAASMRATGTPDTIRMIFIGQSVSPRTATLTRLAEALEVNFHWLATGQGEMDEESRQNRDIERLLGLFDSEDDARRAVFKASHRVLTALQEPPFAFDLSDNDVNSLALTISRNFAQHRDNQDDDIKSMSDDYVRQREIKKLEG
ncbi:MAG: helix-turn-helix transcriptional regulator [Pseudomonadota bacterium]